MHTNSRLSAILSSLVFIPALFALISVAAAAPPSDISIFTAANAGEVLTGGTDTSTPGPDLTHDFDTTVRSGASHTLALNGEDIALSAGHHLVLYNARFDKVATGGAEDRSEINSNLNLAGADLAAGWSQGYIRLQQNQNSSVTAGGAIIEVGAAGDILNLESSRTDTDTNPTVRANNGTGIQLIKLDDGLDYLRLAGHDGTASDQAIPNSTTVWTNVTYAQEDEKDTGAFEYASGTGVTLKAQGHYLVFANTYALGAPSRTAIIQRLNLDGAEVAGSKTTVYLRGNDINQRTDEGAVSIGMILETTAANQILNIQILQDVGRNGMTIDGERTAVTIVKLPDSAEYIRLTDGGNNQNLNPASATALNYDDTGSQVELDAAFTHATGANPSQVGVTLDDDYLFLASQFDADDGAPRAFYNQGWQVNGSGGLEVYGQTGRYSRNTGGADQVGNWSGFVRGLTSGDYVETVTRALGNAGTNNADILALQGVRLSSLDQTVDAVADSGATDEDTAATSVDPPTTTSLFANDCSSPLSLLSADTASTMGAPVTVNPDGTFSYEPAGLFESLNSGDMVFDTFDYTISDIGSKIDLLRADARFDSLTDDDTPATGFGAGNPSGAQNAAGLTFQVTFTPAAGDLDSATAAVNLIEIGGDANGTGLYLLGGEVHFISKMNGGASNVPAAFDDLDFASGNNSIGVKSSFGALAAGTTYTVTAIFDPITGATLDLAVLPAGGQAAVDSFAVTGVGTKTNWSGDDSASALRAGNVANFGGANTVGGNAFSEAAINGNPFEGTAGHGLYWSAQANLLSSSDTATVTIKVNGVNDPPTLTSEIPDQMITTGTPTLDLALFPFFEDVDNDDDEQIYTVTMNTNGTLIQTDPISMVDGILTINTPCTLIGTAEITVTVEDTGGLTISDTFTVEVKDDVDPVISGAKDMFLNAPVGGTVTTNFSGITAADKVDANPMLMCVPNDSFAFPVGSTEVTCTATDASNNSTEEKFFVHVFAIQPVAGARTMTLETLRGDDAPGAGAMGVPAGSSLLVHYTGAMNNGGDVLYSASLSDAGTNNRAVFLRSAGSDAPLAVRNIAAPGASTYGTFSDVTLNNAGSVGFQSATDLGAGHFLDDGVSIHDAATATQTATGTTGEYRVLRKPALTSGGDLLTVSNLKSGVGGVDAKNDTGLWRTATGGVRTLVARESEMSPIASTNYSQIFSRVVASPDNNLYAFSSFLIELPAFNSSNNTGLFVGTVGGSIAVMAREGDPVPNEPGAVIGQFAGEAVNSSGNVAFRGNAKGTGISTANNEGIWWTDGTTLRTIAREGSVAPCLPDELAAFGRFEKVSICDNGSVFFYAFLTDATGTPSVTSANDGSIWRWDPGDGLHLVARESDVALSTDGAQHGTLYDFDCNQVGGIVYHGTFVPDSGDTTSKTRDGVWLASDANDIAPVLVLRRGDTLMLDIDGEMVEHFVANIKLDAQSNPNGGTGGYGKVINDSGEILLNLALNKNKSGLFKMSLPSP